MTQTILKVLYENSKNIPDKPALINKNETITYFDLWNEIVRCSEYLKKEGLISREIVLIKASQSLDYLICYYAIQLAGAIPCSLEKNTPSTVVAEITKKMNAAMIISETNVNSNIKIFSARYIREKSKEITDINFNIHFPEPDDLQIIMFTTGTTGASKGVEITFKAMQASEEKIIDFLEMKKYAEKGLLVTPTPLNHAKGIWEVGGMLRCGGSVYILKGMLDLQAYFNALDYPCEKLLLSLVPANLRMLLLMAPDELKKRADKIGAIKLGTAALLEHDKNLAYQILPDTDLHNPYGSSEAGILCSYKFNKYPGLEFCIGKPLINTEVIIVDENRNPIISSKNNMGMLAFRSNSAMNGYYNEPELTESVFKNGIVYTNDFGYIDENGFVFVRGRADDVINVGGLKVSPDEVEAEAISIPGIADCICISTNDNITGNALKLLVVMKENERINISLIKKFLSKRLEPYKIPKYYEEVDKIEKMYNGKINRKFYR